jgi:hypothetical protein
MERVLLEVEEAGGVVLGEEVEQEVMAIWVVNTMVMETGKGVAVQAEAEAEVEAVEGVVAIVAVGEVMVCLKPSKMQGVVVEEEEAVILAQMNNKEKCLW